MEDIMKALREFRDARDWSQFHSPKNLAVSISIEAGELLELFQWSATDTIESGRSESEIADEAADVIIYALLLFDRIGLDPSVEIMRKIEKNGNRFPIHKAHGRARVRNGE